MIIINTLTAIHIVTCKHISKLLVKGFGLIRYFKEVSSAHQGCIYLMKKTNNNNKQKKQ